MTDSEDDIYYEDEAASDYYKLDEDNNSDEEDNCDVESEDSHNSKNEKNYTVLSEDDISQRQVDNINKVSSFLSITKQDASILLRYYHWNTGEVEDAWFSDEEKVRKSVGLLFNGPVTKYPDSQIIKCCICYDDKRADEFTSTDYCGHVFCIQCWKQYVCMSINDGPGCLTIRCPEPKCRSAVSQDMIHALVSNVHKDKYARFLVSSYVEAYPKIKWCPAPGCEYAVEYDDAGGGYEPKTDYDVICGCSHGFCWNCTEVTHRPVDCDTVAKWVIKSKAESENMTWMLAYTKPCPKCKRSIEKNMGCMHMTCGTHCKFEFCWLCLKPWDGHKNYYNCNRYEKDKQEGKIDAEETMRENAKNSKVKYLHYYERWAANEKARKKAIEDLHTMEKENIDKLCDILSVPMGQLTAVTEAWEQIIECRRVLTWTYAYGYYLPEEDTNKKVFFEYLQGEAEASLERLHHCAETELRSYLNDGTSEDGLSKVKELNTDELRSGFISFRQKLLEFRTASQRFFTNLVNALEDGLSDVNSS